MSGISKDKSASSKTSSSCSLTTATSPSVPSSRLPTKTSTNVASKLDRDKFRPKTPLTTGNNTPKLGADNASSEAPSSKSKGQSYPTKAADSKSSSVKKDANNKKSSTKCQDLSAKKGDNSDTKSEVKTLSSRTDICNEQGNVRLDLDTGQPNCNTDLNLRDKLCRGDKKRDENKRRSSENRGITRDIDSDTNKTPINSCHVVSASQESQGSATRVSVINSNNDPASAPHLAYSGIPAAQAECSAAASARVIDQPGKAAAGGGVTGLTGRSVTGCPLSLPSDGIEGGHRPEIGGGNLSTAQDRKKVTQRSDKTPKTPPLRHRKNVKENENIRVQSETGSNTSLSKEGKGSSNGSTDAGSKVKGHLKPASKAEDLNAPGKTRSMYTSSDAASRVKKGHIRPEVKAYCEKEATLSKPADVPQGGLTSGGQGGEASDAESAARADTRLHSPRLSQKPSHTTRSKPVHGSSISSTTSTTTSEKSKPVVSKGSRAPATSKPRAFKDGLSSVSNGPSKRTNDISKGVALRRLSPHNSSALSSACDTRSVTSSVSDAISVTSSISDIRSVTSSSTRESSVDSRFGDEASLPSPTTGSLSKRLSSTRKSSLSSSSSSSVPRPRRAATLKSSPDKKQSSLMKSVKPPSSSLGTDIKVAEKRSHNAQSFNTKTPASVKYTNNVATSGEAPIQKTAAPTAKSTAETTSSSSIAAAVPSRVKSSQKSEASGQLKIQEKASSNTMRKVSAISGSKAEYQTSKHTSRQIPEKPAGNKLGVKKETTVSESPVSGAGRRKAPQDKSASELDDTREAMHENSKSASGKGRVAYPAERRQPEREKSLMGPGTPRQSLSPATNGKSSDQGGSGNMNYGLNENNLELCLGQKIEDGIGEDRRVRGGTLLAELVGDSADPGTRDMPLGRHVRSGNEGLGEREERVTEEGSRGEERDISPQPEREREKENLRREQVPAEDEGSLMFDWEGKMGGVIKKEDTVVVVNEGYSKEEAEGGVGIEGDSQMMLIASDATCLGNLDLFEEEDIQHQVTPAYGLQTSGVPQTEERGGKKRYTKQGKVEGRKPEMKESGSEKKGQVGIGTHCVFNEVKNDEDAEEFIAEDSKDPDIHGFDIQDTCGDSEVLNCGSLEQGEDRAANDLLYTEREKIRVSDSRGENFHDQEISPSCKPGELLLLEEVSKSGEGKRRAGDEHDSAGFEPPASHTVNCVRSLSVDPTSDGQAMTRPSPGESSGHKTGPGDYHALVSPSSSASTPFVSKHESLGVSLAGSRPGDTEGLSVTHAQASTISSTCTHGRSVDPSALHTGEHRSTHSTPGLQTVKHWRENKSETDSSLQAKVNSSALDERSLLAAPSTPDKDRQKRGEREKEDQFERVDKEKVNEAKETLASTILSKTQEEQIGKEILTQFHPFSSAGLKAEERLNFAPDAHVSASFTSPCASLKNSSGTDVGEDGGVKSSDGERALDLQAESRTGRGWGSGEGEERTRPAGERQKELGGKKEKRKEREVMGAIHSESVQVEEFQGSLEDGPRGGGGEGRRGTELASRGNEENKTEIRTGLSRHGEEREIRRIGFEKQDAAVSSGLLLLGSDLTDGGGGTDNRDRERHESWGQGTTGEKPCSGSSRVGFTGDRSQANVCWEDLTITAEGHRTLKTIPRCGGDGSNNYSGSNSDNNTAVCVSVPSGHGIAQQNLSGRGNNDETCAVERRRSLLRQKLQNCSTNSTTNSNIENRRVQQQRQHQRHLDRSPSWISAADSSFVLYSQSNYEESCGVPTEVSSPVRCEELGRKSPDSLVQSLLGDSTDSRNGRSKFVEPEFEHPSMMRTSSPGKKIVIKV